MTVEEVFKFLEERVAPVSLSDEFCKKCSMYDNSGILIDCGEEVTGIMFSLDLSEDCIKKAKSKGFNLIVTHHPAIYGGISRFDVNATPRDRAVAECIKSGISVISMHLNFDGAPEGIDHHLMCALGGRAYKAMVELEGGAYGRAYKITPVSLPVYIENIAKIFNTKRVMCYGLDKRTVKKVASFCGAGLDGNAVKFAISEKVNAVVSSDAPHHIISELVENGIAVILLSHYCAEAYGFGKIYNKIKSDLGVPSSVFVDARFA